MVYNKTKWQDEIPDLTKPILDSSGKQKTDPQTGRPLFELVQTGTRITSAKLNNIEDGIGVAHTLTEQLAAEVNGNFVSSGLIFTFNNLTAAWTAGVAYVKGRRFEVAAGNLTLTAKQGQYIYLDELGVLQNTTTEATALASLPLWYFATDASKAITSTDSRRVIVPGSYALKSDTVVKEEGKGLSTNDYSDSDKAKVQNHDQQLTDIYPRLNTASSTDLSLQQGIQTINVKRDVPYNVLSLTGRMLLNLLGRRGNFDSLPSGMSLLGGTNAVISTTVKDQGTGSLKVTMSSGTSGISLKLDNTVKVGKSYVAIARVYIESGQDAYIRWGAEFNGSSSSLVITKGSWQTMWATFQASSDYPSGAIDLAVRGTSGNIAYLDSIRVYEIVSPAQVAGYTAQKIEQEYPYTEGLAGVRNPYAIRWTDDPKTDIGAMLAFDTELLSSPTGTNADTLYQGTDGQYYKNSNWNKMTLLGDQAWIFHVNFTGYKSVRLITTGAATSENVPCVTKYDKSVLRLGDPSGAGSGDATLLDNSGNFYITISAADSGWGDSYTPTVEEIQAYFYGYKMYDSGTLTAAQAQTSTASTYNGIGVKTWVNIVGKPVGTSLPTIQANGFMPYQLMYRRASSVVEPLATEGALNLEQGDNIIEIGSGLIIREKVTVFKAVSGSEATVINNIDRPETYLKNKARKIIEIYRDGLHDIRWVLSVDSFAYGTGRAYIANSIGLTSDSESYTVSYLTLDNYPAVSFTGSYPNNERTITDELIRDIVRTMRRVSAVELKKTDKDATVSWITPTLLNGWQNYNSSFSEIGYHKDSLGYVHLRGVLTGGGGNVAVFKLPAGFRPTKILPHTIGVNTNGLTDATGRININPGGELVYLLTNISPTIGSGGWISLANIPPFLAEL